ncbi:hypothetical protein DASB73_015190 [Starmerella bacillaris]|uniref:Uncharacterized protein n=1 Tax=Starmerella bacillaris TaxID=1247836 RepID=A0AAV5RIY3_STABA|nr:hypothetical protein DASB73_015190 [Starmerella bacillaris]
MHKFKALCIRNARCFSSEMDPRLVILNPKEAGLYRKKFRKQTGIWSLNSNTEPATWDLNEDNVNPVLSPASVVAAIEQQKPLQSNLTYSSRRKLYDSLLSGFKKDNLSDYLLQSNTKPPGFSKFTKKDLVNFILTDVWKCTEIEDNISQIENSIDLSERDFVLTLGGGGKLLREFSKNGAKISLWPAKLKIIVKSSEPTFEWIQAKLNQFLETMKVTSIDTSQLSLNLNNLKPQLSAIQQITDSYFQIVNDSLICYTAGSHALSNNRLAKRMLYSLASRDQKWRPTSYYYNANVDSQYDSILRWFGDLESLEWDQKLVKWSRLENSRTKQGDDNNVETDESVLLKPLDDPQFEAASKIEPSSLTKQLTQITGSMMGTLEEGVSRTFTCTFGYLLQQTKEELLPNAGMPKIFVTNIPNVVKVAGTLAHYDFDVEMDLDLESEIMGLGEIQDDSTNPGEIYTTRRKDEKYDSIPNLRHFKFIADPQLADAENYPPIEAWVTQNEDDGLDISMLALAQEKNACISLPSRSADLKFSVTDSITMDPSESNIEFFEKCHKRNYKDVDRAIVVNWQGKIVRYVCLGCYYVNVNEFRWAGQKLQLSRSSGQLKPSSIDATLVADDMYVLIASATSLLAKLDSESKKLVE